MEDEQNDLNDEYRLFIFPVVLGSGKRFFGSGTVPVARSNRWFERVGKPEYGQIGA